MEKDSALYQLMIVRMNGIVSSDGEYQAISRKSDEYSGILGEMELPKEERLQSHVFGKIPANRSKRNGHVRNLPHTDFDSTNCAFADKIHIIQCSTVVSKQP